MNTVTVSNSGTTHGKELLVMQSVRDPVLNQEALSGRYDVHMLRTIHSNTLLEIASGIPGLPVSILTPLNHIGSIIMHHLRL